MTAERPNSYVLFTGVYFFINLNVFKYVRMSLSDSLISAFISNTPLGGCQQQTWQRASQGIASFFFLVKSAIWYDGLRQCRFEQINSPPSEKQPLPFVRSAAVPGAVLPVLDNLSGNIHPRAGIHMCT